MPESTTEWHEDHDLLANYLMRGVGLLRFHPTDVLCVCVTLRFLKKIFIISMAFVVAYYFEVVPVIFFGPRDR